MFFHQNCRFLSYSLHLSLSNQWNFSTHTSSENYFVTSIIFLCGYIQDVFQIGIYTFFFFFSLLFGHYRTGISFSLLQGLTLGIVAREEWTYYTFAFFPNHLLLAYIKTNFTCCYKFLDVINSIFGLSALLHGLAVCPHYLEWLYTISNFFSCCSHLVLLCTQITAKIRAFPKENVIIVISNLWKLKTKMAEVLELWARE